MMQLVTLMRHVGLANEGHSTSRMTSGQTVLIKSADSCVCVLDIGVRPIGRPGPSDVELGGT
jgi:hypothetical protein